MTSRILIVDLLNHILPASSIDGMLVAHADQVTNESTEAFILRIYTSQKKRDQLFIKAFTDSPEGLLSGFSKIDKTLKALQVRNLYLYPRFHEAVKDELEGKPPKVIEIHQPLSPMMQEIQSAIVAAVQTCMRELKKATPFVEWTGEALSIENCVTSNFDVAVSRQLHKDWHRVSPETKRLVDDLRQLRKLFQVLLQYDCVSFWRFLNYLKTNSASARHPSLWMLTPAAERIFSKAKDRVYQIRPGQPTAKVPNPLSTLVPVLEENPKWRLLRKVLGEIRDETRDETLRQPTVLVLVKEEKTVEDLKDYLRLGRDQTLAESFRKYLEQYNDRSRSAISIHISEESRLLLEEEAKVRRILREHRQGPLAGQGQKRPATSTLNTVPQYLRKRQRIALEKGRGTARGGLEDREQQAVLDDALEQVEHDRETANKALNEEEEETAQTATTWQNMFRPTIPEESRVVIKSFSSISEQGDPSLVLADIDPTHVILYDTDIALVRTLEAHAASQQFGHGDNSHAQEQVLNIYFLIFEASAEQKVFTKALEREQTAFVRLIHHKKTMPPPVLHVQGTQEMQQALGSGGMVVNTYAGGGLPLAFDTRRGQGKAVSAEKRDIAVDVREFRSALPSILHQGGMRLAPVTLTVGDYVLSSVHCIERKSISDLFQSFPNGRLYSQAEAMSKYYKCPALLIEFDPDKDFSLQNPSDLGTDIRKESTCSRMVYLTTHFPKLRILWSKSPHETLRLFKELKTNHDEVDVEKAIEIGRRDAVENLLQEEEGDEDEVNEAARDMLLTLPGVNVHNARKIMRGCDSLADLVKLSRTELRSLAGPLAGQKLWTFFNQRYGST